MSSSQYNNFIKASQSNTGNTVHSRNMNNQLGSKHQTESQIYAQQMNSSFHRPVQKSSSGMRPATSSSGKILTKKKVPSNGGISG